MIFLYLDSKISAKVANVILLLYPKLFRAYIVNPLLYTFISQRRHLLCYTPIDLLAYIDDSSLIQIAQQSNYDIFSFYKYASSCTLKIVFLVKCLTMCSEYDKDHSWVVFFNNKLTLSRSNSFFHHHSLSTCKKIIARSIPRSLVIPTFDCTSLLVFLYNHAVRHLLLFTAEKRKSIQNFSFGSGLFPKHLSSTNTYLISPSIVNPKYLFRSPGIIPFTLPLIREETKLLSSLTYRHCRNLFFCDSHDQPANHETLALSSRVLEKYSILLVKELDPAFVNVIKNHISKIYLCDHINFLTYIFLMCVSQNTGITSTLLKFHLIHHGGARIDKHSIPLSSEREASYPFQRSCLLELDENNSLDHLKTILGPSPLAVVTYSLYKENGFKYHPLVVKTCFEIFTHLCHRKTIQNPDLPFYFSRKPGVEPKNTIRDFLSANFSNLILLDLNQIRSICNAIFLSIQHLGQAHYELLLAGKTIYYLGDDPFQLGCKNILIESVNTYPLSYFLNATSSLVSLYVLRIKNEF